MTAGNRSAARRSRWPRRRRAVVALGFLIAAVTVTSPADGGWTGVYDDVFRDGMRGPYGALPRPVAGGAGSLRQVGVASGNPLVIGGLRLETTASNVWAISLRTGRTYWWYHRPGDLLQELRVDDLSSDVYLTWQTFEGSEASASRVDAGTGRVIWHRRLTAPATDEEDPSLEVGGIRADAQTVAFPSARRVFGLAYADGRRLWSSPEPPHCSLAMEPDLTTAAGGVLMAEEQCEENGRLTRYVLGVEARSGRRLWRFDLHRWSHDPGDIYSLKVKPYADGQVIVYGLSDGPSFVLATATGRVLTRGPSVDEFAAGPTEGVLVKGCGSGPRSGGWCGYSYSGGRLLWRRVAPAQPPIAGVTVDGGRVYTLSGNTSRGYTLSVTGLHDGRRLEDLRLPQARYSDGRPFLRDRSVLNSVKDGVVVIDDSGPNALYTDPGRR